MLLNCSLVCQLDTRYVLFSFVCQLETAKVIKEGTTSEKNASYDWPVDKPLEHFLI